MVNSEASVTSRFTQALSVPVTVPKRKWKACWFALSTMEKQDIHQTFRNETSEKCLSLAARTIGIGVQGNEIDGVSETSCSFVTVQIQGND